MHTVMWTFQMPAGTTREELVATIKATAHNYLGIPGLVRKYYGISEDAKTLVGIYLWESKAAADAFYTPEWVAMVRKRWGSEPSRQDWFTPMVVESAQRRLAEAAA